jgi:uncharacterized membrane protein YdjX (TVP38/TMEM64 family)
MASPPVRVSGRGLATAAVAAVAVAAIAVGVAGSLDAASGLRRALATAASLGAWAPALFVLLYVCAALLFLPSWILTLGAGALFGIPRGFALVSFGSTLGATAAFVVARYLARRWVTRHLERRPALKALDDSVAREGWKIVGLMRMSPAFPFNVLNYAFGLTRIPLRHYVLASWIGMMPGTLAYVYLGAFAGELAGGGRARAPVEWLAFGIGLAATVTVTVLVTRLARRALAARFDARATAAGVLGLCALGGAAAAEPARLDVGTFEAPASPDAVPAGWEALTFRRIPRTTRYRVVREGDGFVLRADSEAAASGLYRPLDVDLHAYPVLTWRWKVANVLVKADARRREGDDYPARVYVAFRWDPETASAWERARYGAYRLFHGRYPPASAINYVWDNRLPPGTTLDNAYTGRAKMVVVRSGPAEVGRWLGERRDVLDDYRRLFGGEPPRVAGIALMTDTDDTGERAVAWYDAIVLHSAR